MTESLDTCDDVNTLCRVCGEFYVNGHMPACPNTAAGQPYTWLGAAVEVLRQSAAPLSLDEILRNIREQGLRFVHVRATPKSSLRRALMEACHTPEIPVRRDAQGNFVYDTALYPRAIRSIDLTERQCGGERFGHSSRKRRIRRSEVRVD